MSRHGKTFLHVNGDSVKDAGSMTLGLRIVGLLCRSQGLLTKLISECVQLRVISVDAFKDPARQFHRRDLLFANGFRRLECGGEVEIAGGWYEGLDRSLRRRLQQIGSRQCTCPQRHRYGIPEIPPLPAEIPISHS